MKSPKFRMKNTKHQAPNTRETPNTKRQEPAVVVHGMTRDSEMHNDALVLKDEQVGTSGRRHPFDLEERTAVFGENIVRFSRRILRNPTNDRLIDQLVGAGTSVGGNYCEANDCFSRKDFRYTIKRCLKEAKETRFFLRMAAASEPGLKDEARDLYREASELVNIFASMYRK
jgi:four helix bundle protein